jgi:phytoene dehydrogenase-like protein
MRAIVIGAGFAGLAAALRLAAANYRVTVIDKQQEPGGKAAGWLGVPTGPTMLTMPGVLEQMLEHLGAPPLELLPLSPLARYRWPDGRTFAPQLGLEATLLQLSVREAKDYWRLRELARQIHQTARDTFLFEAPPKAERSFAAPAQSLAQLVQAGPYLTPFFLQFATRMGANPYKAPAALHHLAWMELGLGGYHPVGGMCGLVKHLADLSRERRVQFELGQTVEALETRNQEVLRVRTQQGSLGADVFVAAADRHFTLRWLDLPLPNHELSASGFALQMRLSETVPTEHHVVFGKDYRAQWRDIEEGRLPTDPTFSLHTEDQTALLLVNAPNLNTYRPRDHLDYADLLLSRATVMFGLPIEQWKLVAPQDYAYTAFRGAWYGRAAHGPRGAWRDNWQVAGLKNLVQVGGTVHPGGGVAFSLISGWNGAGKLIEIPAW